MTVCTVVKSKGKISQNFVAFSEYMNFNLKEEGEYYSDQIVEESYESLNELTSNYDQFEAYDKIQKTNSIGKDSVYLNDICYKKYQSLF